MEEQVSYCGIICHGCPIYWATRETDLHKKRKMRSEIARKCNEQYKQNLGPEEIIDCDGCKANSRLFAGCMKCGIRDCARQKELTNCAHCNDYACEKLMAFFSSDPQAKIILDVIRSTIS
ncbi:MAG TPA: DUF3795 domain-containing protein [Bacteroidales bacterium]|nr:DUF3795 domain-containing protein [Bacteroidales bacterium]